MAQMKIMLNGEDFFLESAITISDLVKKLELDIAKIAIERNLEIINLDDFSKITLKPDDKIEIVHFIGGG